MARLTASVGYERHAGPHPLATTVIWGQNREDTGFNGTSNGVLAEWDLGAARASTFYGRAEIAQKELFALGSHPKGFAHPHTYYLISSVTGGYIREILRNGVGTIGVGADITAYGMPDSLDEYYGGSTSYHVFVRWRAPATTPHVH